ncbi:MAG: hypothetical protein ACWGQW_00180 [bacterium]
MSNTKAMVSPRHQIVSPYTALHLSQGVIEIGHPQLSLQLPDALTVLPLIPHVGDQTNKKDGQGRPDY